jgi:hypothetical protein
MALAYFEQVLATREEIQLLEDLELVREKIVNFLAGEGARIRKCENTLAVRFHLRRAIETAERLVRERSIGGMAS